MNVLHSTALLSLLPAHALAVGIVFSNPLDSRPGSGICSPCSVEEGPDFQMWDRMDLPTAASVSAVEFSIDDLTPGGAAYIRLAVAREPGGRYVYTRIFRREEWENYQPPFPTSNRGILIPMPRGVVLPAGTWYFTIFGERGTVFGVRPSSTSQDRSMMTWSFREQIWRNSMMDAGLHVYGELIPTVCPGPDRAIPRVVAGSSTAEVCR